MAKITNSTKFSKAYISEDKGNFTITEVDSKGNETSYDLTNVIKGLVGVQGLSVSFSTDAEVEPIEE